MVRESVADKVTRILMTSQTVIEGVFCSDAALLLVVFSLLVVTCQRHLRKRLISIRILTVSG